MDSLKRLVQRAAEQRDLIFYRDGRQGDDPAQDEAVALQPAQALGALREAESIMDSVKARIPFVSRTLEPKRDVWGQPVTSEGGVGPDIMSPIWGSTRRNDPVNNALLDADAHVGRPDRDVAGHRLPISDYGRYQAMAGMMGYGQFRDMIGTPDWSRSSRDDLFGNASVPPSPPEFSIDPPPAGYVLDR